MIPPISKCKNSSNKITGTPYSWAFSVWVSDALATLQTTLVHLFCVNTRIHLVSVIPIPPSLPKLFTKSSTFPCLTDLSCTRAQSLSSDLIPVSNQEFCSSNGATLRTPFRFSIPLQHPSRHLCRSLWETYRDNKRDFHPTGWQGQTYPDSRKDPIVNRITDEFLYRREGTW